MRAEGQLYEAQVRTQIIPDVPCKQPGYRHLPAVSGAVLCSSRLRGIHCKGRDRKAGSTGKHPGSRIQEVERLGWSSEELAILASGDFHATRTPPGRSSSVSTFRTPRAASTTPGPSFFCGGTLASARTASRSTSRFGVSPTHRAFRLDEAADNRIGTCLCGRVSAQACCTRAGDCGVAGVQSSRAPYSPPGPGVYQEAIADLLFHRGGRIPAGAFGDHPFVQAPSETAAKTRRGRPLPDPAQV